MTHIEERYGLPTIMSVVTFERPGGPDVLQVGERAVPEPGLDDVLIHVAAAGVNGPDIMQRKGLYPPPKGASDLLGLEVSGEIVSCGANVTNQQVGDKVTALVNGGGYAEYCLACSSHCLPIPGGVSMEAAAGLPEAFFTIWSNIFTGADLQKGEVLLIHGGAGGLGSAAIQLGKSIGATVYATEYPDSRCEYCLEIGADRAINYQNEDFVEVIRSEVGGANVILDIVGGEYVQRNIKAAAPDARIVQLAFALGSKMELDLMPIMLKRLSYTGSTLRSRSSDYKAFIARELLQKVWPNITAGSIAPNANSVFRFSEALKAHELMQSAQHIGKILLKPR